MESQQSNKTLGSNANDEINNEESQLHVSFIGTPKQDDDLECYETLSEALNAEKERVKDLRADLLPFSHWFTTDKERSLGNDIYDFYKAKVHLTLNSSNVEFILIPVNKREPRIESIDDVIYFFDNEFALFTECYLAYNDKYHTNMFCTLVVSKAVFWSLKTMIDYVNMICPGCDHRDFFDMHYDDCLKIFKPAIDHANARDAEDADIEENPGPVTPKQIFNEMQMQNWSLNKWSEEWTIDESENGREYSLRIYFPRKNIIIKSDNKYSSKKQCEENCLAQLIDKISHIRPQSGLVMSEGELKASDEITENTILTSVQDKTTVENFSPNVDAKYLSENVFSDPNLVGVQFWLKRFTWDANTTLTSFKVPKELFSTPGISSAAIAKAFQVHSIYRAKGSFIFKPVANKFNSGFLGVTFFPMFSQLSGYDQSVRSNKYSLSQLPTKYINACSSNEVQVDFDFFYPLNYASASERASTLESNNIGTLFIYPLNPLTIGEQGTKWSDINIFLHFTELEFIGKLDQRINPQSGLLGGLADMGMNAGKKFLSAETGGMSDMALDLLNDGAKKLSSNGNADFPVDPSPGSFVIPNYLPSFSSTIGTCQPINSLGLKPDAQVKHKYPVSDSFKDLVQVRSLFKQVDINITSTPTLIASWSNVPLKPFAEYAAASDGARFFTSLSVVSGLFQQYKGRIIYDILVAMTDKHNIKFMIGTIPASNIPNTATIDETFLRNSKFQELNFADGNFSASYEAPYFGTKKWTRIPSDIRINADCRSASYVPSVTYLVALSRLSYSTGVSTSITLNIFERAGSDFELSVYKPAIMTPIHFTNRTEFLSLYSQWNQPQMQFSVSQIAPRSGNDIASASSNGIFLNCWFNNVKNFPVAGVFAYRNQTGIGSSIPGVQSQWGCFIVPFGYTDRSAVLAYVIDAGVGTPNPAVYTALSEYAANTRDENKYNAIRTFLIRNQTTTPFVYFGNDYGFAVTWTTDFPPPSVAIEPQSGLEGRMESFQPQESAFDDTEKRNWGEEDFGENFESILNLLKRGHNDWPIVVNINNTNAYPNAAFRLKVTPIPIYNPTIARSDPRAFTAGGILSVIYSGFMGYKGSLHYHLLCPPAVDTQLWVNYFPDAYTLSDITLFPISLNGAEYSPTLVPSAPKCYFNLSLNSAARVKIPFYSCSEFILLNNNTIPQEGRFGDELMITSMGSLLVGFDSNNNSDLPEHLKVNIIKSVGDDGGLYNFIGFPPMFHYSEFPTANFEIARNSTMADIEENPGPMFSRFAYNFGSSLGEGLSSQLNKDLSKEIGSGLCEGFMETSLPFMEEFKNTLINQVEGLKSLFQDFNLSSVLLEFITQIGHCVISKTWYNCIWAVLMLFVKFGLFSLKLIPDLCSKFLSYLSSLKLFSSQPNFENSDDIQPQNHEDNGDKFLISYISIFATSICALIGISSNSLNVKSIAGNFSKVLKESLQCGNALTSFLKSHIDLLSDIFLRAKHYIVGTTKEGVLLSKIMNNGQLIGNWIKEVDFLCDPINITNIASTPALQVRVRVCYLVGRSLQAQLVQSKDKAGMLFNNYFKRIGEKYDELAVNGFISHIREVPFVIYNFGLTGIGKSELSTDLVAHLFSAENIRSDGELMYTVSSTSDHYDGLTTQPCVYIDDFLAINDKDVVLKQFDLLYSAATSATWRPKQAALEDKKKMSAPALIYINSNLKHINHDTVMDNSALNRRLQYKIHSKMNPSVVKQYGKDKASDLPMEVVSNFKHLLFRVHLDPYKYQEDMWTKWMNYEELKKHAASHFKIHRQRAEEARNRRMIAENMWRTGTLFSEVTYENLQDPNYIQSKVNEFITEVIDIDNSESYLAKMTRSLYEDVFNNFYMLKNNVFGTISDLLFPNALKNENEEETTVEPQNIDPYESFKTYVSSQKDKDRVDKIYSILNHFEITYPTFIKDFSRLLSLFSYYEIYKRFENFLMCGMCKNGYLIYCDCTMVDWIAKQKNISCEKEDCMINDKVIALFKSESKLNSPLIRFKEMFIKFKDLVKRVVAQLIDSLKPLLSTTFGKLLILIVGVGVVFSTFKLISFVISSVLLYFGLIDDEETKSKNEAFKKLDWLVLQDQYRDNYVRPQTVYDGLQTKGKARAPTRSNLRSLQQQIRPQSQDFSDKISKMRRNFRYISMGSQEEYDNNKDLRFLPILGVSNRDFLFLKHYLLDINKNLECGHIIKFIDGNTTITLTADNFQQSDFTWRESDESSSELGIWRAPASVSMVPDITKHFISERQFSKAGPEVYIVSNIQRPDHPDVVTKITPFSNKNSTSLSNFNHIIQYENYSQNGNCMSIIFNISLKAPIAVHAFGNVSSSKQGYGELIFKETFKGIEEPIDIPTFEDLEEIKDEDVADYMKKLKIIGKVPSHQTPFAQGKTQLEKSPIYEEIAVQNKEPAPLSQFDWRCKDLFDPMVEGVKKHGNPPLSFNKQHLKICAEDIHRKMMQCAPPCRVKPDGSYLVEELSVKDAIIGIPEHAFKALDLTTSPGYPLVNVRGRGIQGKRGFIHTEIKDGKYILNSISSNLKQLLAMERKMRINRQMPFSPAIDCLKDELLKVEKARRAGGTRVFSISPVQQVIAGKRIFGDWLMSYRKNWKTLEHGISINPESNDWAYLYEQLKTFPNVLEGDYSNFGPQADSEVAKAALNNIITWYKHYGANKEHVNQLEVMREEFINSPHLCREYFYSTNSGIISGSFATAEINSEINKLYIRLAWCSLVEPNMKLFNENVVFYTYGDDVIACVSDAYIDKFNVVTMSKFFERHNIKFTNASKGSELIKSIDLKDATFLKRGFRLDPDVPNQCLANLDKISIEEQLNWVKRSEHNDRWELVFQSVDSCLRSASMWGKDYYNTLKAKIENSMIKHLKSYCFKSFEQQISDIYYPTNNDVIKNADQILLGTVCE